MRRRLIIMVKQPRPGRVKTRLARDIGRVEAAWWYRHQMTRLLRNLRDPRWQITLAIAPDRATQNRHLWPSDLPRLPQGRGDLGDRMRRMLEAPPPGPVCLIGSDIPGITRRHIAHAFQALGTHDGVFGPAPDGGYWLVGMRRPLPRNLFAHVRWSSPHALSDTLAPLHRHRIARIDTLADVDTAADLALSSAPQRLPEGQRHRR